MIHKKDLKDKQDTHKHFKPKGSYKNRLEYMNCLVKMIEITYIREFSRVLGGKTN